MSSIGQVGTVRNLRTILCLANSLKHGERCIAGIDIETGEWIRPVCDVLYPQDGRVPVSARLVEGREPRLLDILKIPLADQGNNFGFEKENLSILPGTWQRMGEALPYQLIQFCSSSPLHNQQKKVLPSYLQTLPQEQRHTLQLIRTPTFWVNKSWNKWKGNLAMPQGGILADITITDPVLLHQLESGYKPPASCFVTLSLSMPWAPEGSAGEKPCWKLIAGVIPDWFTPIGEVMKQLGWNQQQGREFVQQRFGPNKYSLRQLTLGELQQVLDHLETLVS